MECWCFSVSACVAKRSEIDLVRHLDPLLGRRLSRAPPGSLEDAPMNAVVPTPDSL